MEFSREPIADSDEGRGVPYTCLDSVRGLAALMVAIGHTVIVLQIDGVTNLWTTAFLDLPGLQAVIAKTVLFPANGTAAVSLFFVLSGLVLTLSLNRTTGRWPSVAWWFFIRRIIRLYPPWLVSLAVVGATIPLVLQFGPSPQDSSWFRSHYQEAWTLETWARNLALASVTLNSVGWTLQVEFFAALLIVCWWGIRRAVPSALTDVTLLLAIAWVSSHWNGGPLIGVFALSFYLGSLIPQIGWVVGTLYRCHPVLPSLTLVPGWIMLVTAAHLASTVPCRVLYEAVGAAWCLTVVFESPLPSVRAILLARPIHLLGKVSFSFYLLHFPILYVFGRVTLHWLPTQILVNWPLLVDLTLGCVSIVFAAGLALVMFYAVERPGLNLGKQFGIRMGALPLDRANIPWISRPGIPSVMDGSASS